MAAASSDMSLGQEDSSSGSEESDVQTDSESDDSATIQIETEESDSVQNQSMDESDPGASPKHKRRRGKRNKSSKKRKSSRKKKYSHEKSKKTNAVKSNRHRYQISWETHDSFKSWVKRSSKGQAYFYCTACKQDYSCQGGSSILDRHVLSKKHILNIGAIQNQRSIFEMQQVAQQTSQEVARKRAEIRIALFMAEHNMSFNSADHLVSLIKAVAPVAESISCNRTKCTKILTNVVSKDVNETLIKTLQVQEFALLLDESTDRSADKHLSLVVRYCTENLDVIEQSLCLLPCPDATAKGLHTSITTYFKDKNIPYKKNMVGLGSDGPAVMTGVHKGLHKLFKEEIPNLFVVKCSCHSLAIVAHHACEKIPKVVEDLLREVYTYLRYSCKRLSALKEFQDFVGVKPHKIFKFFDVRWLSLHACVHRLLEQWSALRLFFQHEAFVEKSETAKQILNKFNAVNKLYLLFLDHVLPQIADLNLEFQSEKPKVHKIYSSISTLYKTILDAYMQPQHMKEKTVETYEFNKPKYFKKLDDIYLGGPVAAALGNEYSGLAKNLVDSFKTNCLNFYVECCTQIHRVFPFSSPEMKSTKFFGFLKPQNIPNIESVGPAASFFKHALEIDLNKIDVEYRTLRNLEIFDDPNFEKMELLTFWKKINCLKKGDGSEAFPLLMKLVRRILILPHSSASVERIFSAVNLNVTKIRNRLETDTVDSVIHGKSFCKINNKCCYDVPIPKSMIARHRNTMYE